MKKSRFAIFFLCVILLVASLSVFTACAREVEPEPHPMAGTYVGYHSGRIDMQFYMVIEEQTLVAGGKEYARYLDVKFYSAHLDKEIPEVNYATCSDISDILLGANGDNYWAMAGEEYPSLENTHLELWGNLTSKHQGYGNWIVELSSEDRVVLRSKQYGGTITFKRDDISLDDWKGKAYKKTEDGKFIYNGETGELIPYFYEENN